MPFSTTIFILSSLIDVYHKCSESLYAWNAFLTHCIAKVRETLLVKQRKAVKIGADLHVMYCTRGQQENNSNKMTRAPTSRQNEPGSQQCGVGGAATSRPPPHPNHRYPGHGANNRYHRMPPPALKFSTYNCRYYPFYDFPRWEYCISFNFMYMHFILPLLYMLKLFFTQSQLRISHFETGL